MPNLSIKDVPEVLAEALRQRAARNHRSLQGELMAIVEQAANESTAEGLAARAGANPDPGAPRIVGYDRRGYPIVRQGFKTVEQVVAELREKFPEPILGQPLGVDIIRGDRDNR